MSNKARFETEITGDSVGFQRSVEQAERRAETFTGRVESLFRRTGSIRAERAIDAFANRLATGDIVGGLEAITGRMTGLGFAAAIGFGIAGVAASKLGEDISKNQEKIKALSDSLEIPEAAVSGLGFEGIKKQIADVTKQMIDLVAARETFTHKLAGAIPGVGAFTGVQDVIGMLKERQGTNRMEQYFADEAKAAEAGVEVSRLKTQGHLEEAKALEAVLKAQEKISQIELGRLAYKSQIEGSKLPKSEQDKLIGASDAAAEREKKAAATDTALGLMKQIQDQQEKYKLSIKDLAAVATPRTVRGSPWFNRSDEEFTVEGNQNAISPQALYNARQARLVQSLRDRADDLMKNQADPVGAKRLRDQADVEARKISTVKESEKGDPATPFMQALNSTVVPALEQLIEVVNTKLTFANQ